MTLYTTGTASKNMNVFRLIFTYLFPPHHPGLTSLSANVKSLEDFSDHSSLSCPLPQVTIILPAQLIITEIIQIISEVIIF